MHFFSDLEEGFINGGKIYSFPKTEEPFIKLPVKFSKAPVRGCHRLAVHLRNGTI